MKKALYLHGFLGSPEDMEPLYLEGFTSESYDLTKILSVENYVDKLASEISEYDFILGYSFGGRILEELKTAYPQKSKKWIFVSSRHSIYSLEELKDREVFREKLFSLVDDREAFFEYWVGLDLFSGHKMSDYRAERRIGFKAWSQEQIITYLEWFFNSPQVEPHGDENMFYFYGENDTKYSKEAVTLKNKGFNTCEMKGLGHRCLFEDVDHFRSELLEIVK